MSRDALLLWRFALAAAVLAAACALTIDEPVARALAAYAPSAAWDRGIDALEYATGLEPWPWTTILVLVGGSLACLVRWRAAAPAWLYVTGSYLLARNLMMWGKLLTGRLRPTEWLAHGGGGTWLRAGFSFPSGHVVIVAGLVVPLAIAAPRVGRPLLATVGFAMIARVAVGAHFVSDTLGALALCCACAALWEPVRRRFKPR